jgi:hypothetical protein
MDSIKIATGNEVFDLCNDPDFSVGWDRLYELCPWGTSFQSRGFVSNWYKFHLEEFLPLLVFETKAGKLNGILPLTIPLPHASSMQLRNKRVRLVGAGGYDAEYHTWLSPDLEEGEIFIRKALDAVFAYYPTHDLSFRFLPATTPLNWVHTDSCWKQSAVLQPYERPLMEMYNPDFLKIPKKRGFKLKLNRLKRLGKVEFKSITDLEDFSDKVREIAIQFDFRQGSMFNKISYLDRPHRIQFLIALHKEGLLHTTVLLLNDKIIASIIAVKTRKWVHLGCINSHSPFHAHHSPGFVHFILLGQQLVEDKIDVFDLTPGGDAYKHRMATNSDTVHELLITNNKGYFLKRKMRMKIHGYLTKSGRRPQSMELEIRKKFTFFKAKLACFKTKNILRCIQNYAGKEALYIFTHPKNYHLIDELPVKENSLEDLLYYSDRLSRWAFLETAMKKLENGENAYTWVENNQLMACIWTSLPNPRQLEKYGLNLDKNDILFNNFYHHPAVTPKVQQFMAVVCKKIDKKNSYVKVIDNTQSIATLSDVLSKETQFRARYT